MTSDVRANRMFRATARELLLQPLVLGISCVISFWLMTHLLRNASFIPKDDSLLGGMWAVAATVFVFRYSYEESVRAALSRMAATSVSFLLCFVYLLILPFHVWGLGAVIAIGAIAVILLGRPDELITASITSAVVMVVAAISPHEAWREPILRVIDTAVGSAVGLAAAWSYRASLRHQF